MFIKLKSLSISVLLVICILCSISPVKAQTAEATESDALRAAYLASVVRYVTWPDEENKNSLIIGVLGSEGVYVALNQVPIEQVRGMDVYPRLLTRPSQVPDVDVVYVAPSASGQLTNVFNQVRRNPVLVVSEHSPVHPDMMINLIARSENQLAFQVNNERINNQGLRSSGDLLMLRGSELQMLVDQRERQLAVMGLEGELEDMRDQLNATRRENNQLHARVQVLEQTIRERDQALRAQQGTLDDKQQVMESQQEALNELLRELDQQRDLILAREEQLQEIQDTLQESESALEEQRRELDEKERQLADKQREGDILADRIATNRDVLAAQQQQLRDQREALQEQASLLESRERTIDRQRTYLLWIGAGFFVALIFGITTIAFYLNKKKTANQLMETLDELHQAQDKLVESEKMAALGNLVAGVAHEVNTPLGVALTATSMMNDKTRIIQQAMDNESLKKSELEQYLQQGGESLELTEKNLKRVARLIQNFKQVAVDQMVSERREIDLSEYLEEVMSTLSIELRKSQVEALLDVEDEISMTTIPGAMAQILTNLVTNSIRHAFDEDGGEIRISAYKAEGNRVIIKFSDNGKGMNAETLQRMFDPFFTTKRNQGGTGLGMPIVYNLVRQKLHGDIEVESTPDKGTTFTLNLPRC